jgi:hypothetical protein
MTYRGRVKNGVIVLDPPTQLPEGEEVLVNVVTNGTPDRTWGDVFGDVIGSVKDGPADSSDHVDHYLYGSPKE